MLKNKAFVKKTRKGNIAKVVREHYLRDDVKSGTPWDPDCGPEDARLSAEASHYIVIDSNVALHHIDFLEHPAVEDVIVPHIVLQEVNKRNKSIYDRLRALTDASSGRRFFVFLNEHHRSTYVTQGQGESDNDRNDRAIRVATKWYVDLLERKMEVVLLTDDVANRHKAERELGLKAESVVHYARHRSDCKELLDVANRYTSNNDLDIGDEDTNDRHKRMCKRPIYTEHLPLSRLKTGIQNGIYHQGTITTSRSCWYSGMIESESLNSTIKIVGIENINRAVSGDVVAVQLIEETTKEVKAKKDASEGQDPVDTAATSASEDLHHVPIDASGAALKYPAGKVVGIIKRNWKTTGYVASIKLPKNTSSSIRSGNVVCKPTDRRYPPILVRTFQVQELLGKRIVVTMDAWSNETRLPTGHYVRTFGKIGDKDAETEALLFDNDVHSNPFSPVVHACVPALPWNVPESEMISTDRMDLRDRCICSIDPPGCKDIDDALHVRKLPHGNYELGVHIADVTHFMTPGTPLDVEAAKRSTTVYLVQTSISMLPRPLTEEICSLKSDVDRLAFSVLWEVTPDGDVLPEKTVFTKSLIRSRASLSYAEAQSRIDDNRLTDHLTQNLRQLNTFGKIFRSRRKESGALELASSEVTFQIDSETQDPTDVAVYQTMDTNRMVEELMLLANTTVAEKILQSFPQLALLRRHPEPPVKKFEPLQAALSTKGFQLDLASNKSLSTSLDKAVLDDDPYFNTLVRMMTTKCMNEARYFVAGECSRDRYYHYGLAMELYTHFTSPIRRYADVIVHRLLAASIGLEQSTTESEETMMQLIENMNDRHKNAQFASRASASLYTLVFFRNREVTTDGWITGFAGVERLGLSVHVQKYGIEGSVFVVHGLTDDESHFRSKTTTEVVSVTGRCYCIFDRVRIRIEVTTLNGYDEELLLSLIE